MSPPPDPLKLQPASVPVVRLRWPKHRHEWWLWGLGALVLFLAFLVWLTWRFPLSRTLEPTDNPGYVFVSADGKPFARRGFVMEEPVDSTKLPDRVVLPFLAVEDRRFRRHAGVDLKAVMRALRVNARAGDVVEGGSTITQQLAKTAFLEEERTLRRKLQEAILAVWLEARLSKDEILSRYLSAVYFGDGVYGLRGAARHYFGKAPEELDVREAAMLAGLLKAPTRYAPTKHPKAARERYRVVMATLADAGVLTAADARKLAASPPKVRTGRERPLPSGHWFADWIMPQVNETLPRGYGVTRVQTTLDSRLQRRAEQTVRRYLAGEGRAMGVRQAALVAMRTDGRVVAMVGGRDYKASVFNRATQARRQPGSAFKVFVWGTALRNGLRPEQPIDDVPIRIGTWQPRNFEDRYDGRITLAEAFAKSSNVASARLTHWAGPERVVETARRYGVQSELDAVPSLALGTEEVTLIELTSAYAAVFRGYGPVRPWGLASAPPREPQERLAEAPELVRLLGAAVHHGTGRRAALTPATFGKTGTTQNFRDAVFVGYARGLVVGVWVGNDDGTPMRRVTGGSIPAAIFHDFIGGADAPREGPRLDIDAWWRSLNPFGDEAAPEPLDVPIQPYAYPDEFAEPEVMIPEGPAGPGPQDPEPQLPAPREPALAPRWEDEEAPPDVADEPLEIPDVEEGPVIVPDGAVLD